jgi:hypothetical protein
MDDESSMLPLRVGRFSGRALNGGTIFDVGLEIETPIRQRRWPKENQRL